MSAVRKHTMTSIWHHRLHLYGFSFFLLLLLLLLL
jgi:hypothetical protein